MARMKTFLTYALALIGFIFLSYVLENGLIENMYNVMSGNVNSGSYSVSIGDATAKASNVNGYMQFSLRNESNSTLNCYAKIDLYSKQGLNAATQYVEVLDLVPNEKRNYQVKFKANEIASYEISLVSEVPDKTNIINVFGWEVDLTNVFGMDLTNVKIFGVKLTEIFTWDNVKTAGGNAWNWTKVILASIPWWGYAIGGAIVLWHMPSWYLFGIFPF